MQRVQVRQPWIWEIMADGCSVVLSDLVCVSDRFALSPMIAKTLSGVVLSVQNTNVTREAVLTTYNVSFISFFFGFPVRLIKCRVYDHSCILSNQKPYERHAHVDLLMSGG